MKACPHCGSERCAPAFFHLCPSCNGEGCHACRDNLVYGVVPGRVDGDQNIQVCSEYQDPEVDGLIRGDTQSLIACVTAAREALIREREEAQLGGI